MLSRPFVAGGQQPWGGTGGLLSPGSPLSPPVLRASLSVIRGCLRREAGCPGPGHGPSPKIQGQRHHLVPSQLAGSHPCLFPSCLSLPWLFLPVPACSCPALSFPAFALHNSALPILALPCPVLLVPALSLLCLSLSCLLLPCLSLPVPAPSATISSPACKGPIQFPASALVPRGLGTAVGGFGGRVGAVWDG